METEIKTKKCTKCGEVKGLDEFYNNKDGKYGKQSTCKICMLMNRKKYYKKYKNNILKSLKEYYKKNKDKIRKSQKEYKENNKNKIRKYQKEYKEKMKDILNCKARTYRRKNIEKRTKYQRQMTKIYREKLYSCYIRDLLNDNKYSIERNCITQDLIEIKRRLLIIKRLIKQKRQNKTQEVR